MFTLFDIVIRASVGNLTVNHSGKVNAPIGLNLSTLVESSRSISNWRRQQFSSTAI